MACGFWCSAWYASPICTLMSPATLPVGLDGQRLLVVGDGGAVAGLLFDGVALLRSGSSHGAVGAQFVGR